LNMTDTGDKEESLADILKSLDLDSLDRKPAETPGTVVDITPERTDELATDIESLTGGEPSGLQETVNTASMPTEEFVFDETSDRTSTGFTPEVSYTGFISDEDKIPEEESLLDVSGDEAKSAMTPETVTDFTTEIGAEDMAVSYTEFLGADIGGTNESGEILHDEAVLDLADEHDSEMSLEDEPLAFGTDELSLDASDFNLETDENTFAFDSEELAASPETDEIAFSADEDSVVISNGDNHDEISDEMDFLGVDEPAAAKNDAGFLGVADPREAKLPEIMLDGIEMNPIDQMTSVTRAELLIAQGRRDLARDIYERISRERGVSPFVTKRLQQLRVSRSETSAEAEELANQ